MKAHNPFEKIGNGKPAIVSPSKHHRKYTAHTDIIVTV